MIDVTQLAKLAVRRALYDLRYHIGPATEAARLREFFAMMRPVTTDRELIRIGAAGDGGYLVPNDLEGIRSCFSPGVSTVADFEDEMTRRGIRCYLADYSVDSPPLHNALFDFERKFIGLRNDAMHMTLEDWVQRKAGPDGDHVLQMDIEGAEYAVLLDAPRQLLTRFRVLAIEFHALERLFDAAGFDLFNLTFTKLLRDFELVHIHPNNACPVVRYLNYEVPAALEMSFIRKDRIRERRFTERFPHPLDQRNVESRPDVVLPHCWYAG